MCVFVCVGVCMCVFVFVPVCVFTFMDGELMNMFFTIQMKPKFEHSTTKATLSYYVRVPDDFDFRRGIISTIIIVMLYRFVTNHSI